MSSLCKDVNDFGVEVLGYNTGVEHFLLFKGVSMKSAELNTLSRRSICDGRQNITGSRYKES
jgi:hypothetical protein